MDIKRVLNKGRDVGTSSQSITMFLTPNRTNFNPFCARRKFTNQSCLQKHSNEFQRYTTTQKGEWPRRSSYIRDFDVREEYLTNQGRN